MRRLVLLPALLLAVFSFTYAEDEPGSMALLIKQLGAENYDDREAALKALKAYGDEARPFLKKALESDDPEVRWRASRLLSGLDGKKVVRLKDEEDLDEDLSLLRRHLESLRQGSTPRDEPGKGFFFDFGDEKFQEQIDRLMRELSRGLSPYVDEPPFMDMQDLMEELGKSDGGLRIDMNGLTATYRLERDGESMRLEVANDGSVKATLTTKDGKESVYEADSLEAFKKSYPEVADRINLDLLPLPHGGSAGQRPLLWTLPESNRKTLGLFLDAEGPGKALRYHLGLKPGEGVIVDKVQAGSFAARLGLEPMDIIVAINGKAVGSAMEIRTVMGGVESGEEAKVTLIRKGRSMELTGRYPV